MFVVMTPAIACTTVGGIITVIAAAIAVKALGKKQLAATEADNTDLAEKLKAYKSYIKGCGLMAAGASVMMAGLSYSVANDNLVVYLIALAVMFPFVMFGSSMIKSGYDGLEKAYA